MTTWPVSISWRLRHKLSRNQKKLDITTEHTKNTKEETIFDSMPSL
jgi:hypothetical protein